MYASLTSSSTVLQPAAAPRWRGAIVPLVLLGALLIVTALYAPQGLAALADRRARSAR